MDYVSRMVSLRIHPVSVVGIEKITQYKFEIPIPTIHTKGLYSSEAGGLLTIPSPAISSCETLRIFIEIKICFLYYSDLSKMLISVDDVAAGSST